MKILIIDDDRTVCTSLQLLVSKHGGYTAKSIHQPNIALETIAEFKPDLILLDMNFTIDTSGKQGMRLLQMIRAETPSTSVILMTGWATVQLAVAGMKLGARDFVAKPWENKSLLNSIKSIEQLHHSNPIKKTSRDKETNIIGQSSEMLEIMDMVQRVAATEASVLITGESGTGKELIAEAIHQKSLRKVGPFVKVNLGGISSDLFESEMFGHLKGSFTGAYVDRDGRFSTAHTGTIFLDEIGELPLHNQVKMLRVLQEKTFEKLGSNDTLRSDVRVISATNRDIQMMAIEGSFREDLFYRINLINIHLPPLRERKTDIPHLVKYFLSNIADLYSTDIPYLNDDTQHWLTNQEYKGNIRQLKNTVERTFLLNLNKKELTMKDFMPAFSFSQPTGKASNTLNLQQLEIETIHKALAKYNHSVSSTSRALGITRSSLYRRLEKYGISHEPRI